ncbi:MULTISPECIES: hypothetical protein [unclassified Oceanispirochaeta]|uniref:hypothetical protein n=1 Tax=unclassified Oceanispirochaeta TaxID=2635722 RepID=UPI000E094B2D|nr:MULTISPECIES: hypothetical protein [unclassified Oceanispirochaeta]MBF9014744.1 hypothetical protein [Oceanispirochaeta sp. M2]NPD71000.1 hypothetical protein [Oceanispirochaeta sp. M1]RDG33833.1 hypothetical protein DV872_02710 [Oceanispirochaeta sp. M1]
MESLNQFWTKSWETLPEVKAFMDGERSSLSESSIKQIESFLRILQSGNSDDPSNSSFMAKAAQAVVGELKSANASDFVGAALKFASQSDSGSENLLELFFPEARFGGDTPEEQIKSLRAKRTVSVESLNPDAITDPASQMIFTANVLLTLPPDNYKKRLTPSMLKRVESVENEEQKYWFDHPILMGVETEANEMVYGLKGLADTFAYEKNAGNAAADSKMTVLLSLSVTHNGLKALAQEYLASELEGYPGLDDLEIYIFTEEDTEALSALLAALLTAGSSPEDTAADIAQVFGVDGRYGRHYSFLKAIIPLWSIAVDPGIKGTFKIDLDQVFPQKELKAQTGKTAFEHFMSELWGARGKDSSGRDVVLGMIAGALVNEKDIAKSLFTPDVPLPPADLQLKGETQIFHKQLPMAVSTLAEMMTDYSSPGMPDGKNTCLSRVHVTGGTNGILCSVLRKKRPFTPTFIGRAEDQGYLLSVLFDEEGGLMRYVHEPGLIMRHDKDAFAGEAIAAAKQGTWVADLLRILYFSYYAEFLQGSCSAVKEELDPFTGCFISTAPITRVFLRLILKVLESPEEADSLLAMAELQLSPFISEEENSDSIRKRWEFEKRAWNLYYDALDRLEEGIKKNDASGKQTAAAVKERLLSCRIS